MKSGVYLKLIPTNANNCRLHINVECIGNPELKAAMKCVHEYIMGGSRL